MPSKVKAINSLLAALLVASILLSCYKETELATDKMCWQCKVYNLNGTVDTVQTTGLNVFPDSAGRPLQSDCRPINCD